MSFLLKCPNCGKRPVGEFSYRGELKSRPSQHEDFEAWTEFVYMADNTSGQHDEWWYHSSGCQRWFVASRDTTNSTDHNTFWYDEFVSGRKDGTS